MLILNGQFKFSFLILPCPLLRWRGITRDFPGFSTENAGQLCRVRAVTDKGDHFYQEAASAAVTALDTPLRPPPWSASFQVQLPAHCNHGIPHGLHFQLPSVLPPEQSVRAIHFCGPAICSGGTQPEGTACRDEPVQPFLRATQCLPLRNQTLRSGELSGTPAVPGAPRL